VVDVFALIDSCFSGLAARGSPADQSFEVLAEFRPHKVAQLRGGVGTAASFTQRFITAARLTLTQGSKLLDFSKISANLIEAKASASPSSASPSFNRILGERVIQLRMDQSLLATLGHPQLVKEPPTSFKALFSTHLRGEVEDAMRFADWLCSYKLATGDRLPMNVEYMYPSLNSYLLICTSSLHLWLNIKGREFVRFAGLVTGPAWVVSNGELRQLQSLDPEAVRTDADLQSMLDRVNSFSLDS